MPPKRPACEPCRSRKLACDHGQPVCSRCSDADKASACKYRLRPFKKRKARGIVPNNEPVYQRDEIRRPNTSTSSTQPLKTSRHYPNPGYLGASSHTTLFDRLSTRSSPSTDGRPRGTWRTQQQLLVNDEQIAQGASLIRRVRDSAAVPIWGLLIEVWLAKGVNFALATAYTRPCASTATYIFEKFGNEKAENVVLSRYLFCRSCSPMAADVNSTEEEFCHLFCQDNVRWETIGLFFTAVSRATIDIPSFDALYSSDRERCNLQRIAMQFSDSCLEFALSLDCLNDLQLMLQYENFILHSLVDGDQSYHSWKRMGDVSSSLFALGYHEEIGHETVVPAFLRRLRLHALSRAYSADKNVSIFLGRPPRIQLKYCLTLPRQFTWTSGEDFSYEIETQWSAVCAILKEEILDLRKDDFAARALRASRIETDAEAQWACFPVQFRLDQPLISYDRRAVKLDFMVSARLNYMHVIFLLRAATVVRITELDTHLVAISADILSLVVEAIVMRQYLANSGTSLIWKVTYYGLSAAGVICLALLHHAIDTKNPEISVAKLIRNLSVLVAEVENGALARLEDPNYALLSSAVQTISSLLDRLIANRFTQEAATQPAPDSITLPTATYTDESWNLWDASGLQDFPPEFWTSLAEHPFLTSADTVGELL